MLKLANKNLVFPELYPEVRRIDPYKDEDGIWRDGEDWVGDFRLRKNVDIMPQEGLQEQLCHCDSNWIFICGQATSGKAQPYDAKILTPNGFVDMGSLKVGDTITGRNGKSQTVLQIFEQGVKDVYRLHFDDGSQTECEKNHLWKISKRHKGSNNPYGKYRVVTFEEVMHLLDSNYAVCVPYCEKVEFTPKELPISPYTLGALLGDGNFPKRGNPWITCADTEILEKIESDGYNVNKIPSHDINFIISGKDIANEIKKLDLWDKRSWNKFIPEIYKQSSIEDRTELIRGLMDTDGCVDKTGRLYFATASKQLAEDFQWIIRSLGGRCSITENEPKYIHNGEKKVGRTSYCLWPWFNGDENCVTIKRKKDRTVPHIHKRKKAIISYEYVGKKQCRCILVSNDDHLYITDDFIVTHNTFGMMMSALKGLGKKNYTVRFISVRLNDSQKGSSILRDAINVWGGFGGCEYNTSGFPTFYWNENNNSYQLIHSNFNTKNPQEWIAFQEYCKKHQAAMILHDEVTDESFEMFTFWSMRNRDDSGMTPQMIASFNPRHEHWTTKMLKDAGYIGDDWFIKPEMDGVTKYFYVQGDTPESIIWGDTKEEVVAIADPQLSEGDMKIGLTQADMVKSFTMFTGEASGNKKLVAATGGQSVANLHAVGGTQRSVVGKAYFGPIDDETLDVTRQMIHNLWVNPIGSDENMYATLDVSAGGKDSDNCPMIIWKGLQIVAIKLLHVDTKTLVDEINRILALYNVPMEHFAFDATGIGYYLQDFTKGQPITANKRPVQEVDAYGNPVVLEPYFNLRSQLIGKTKVMLERGDISVALDKDTVLQYGKRGQQRQLINILFDEMNVFVSTTRNNKIYYKDKGEYKAKFHASPDLMDTICYRAIFELDARPKKQPEPEVAYNAYDALYHGQQWRQMAQRHRRMMPRI